MRKNNNFWMAKKMEEMSFSNKHEFSQLYEMKNGLEPWVGDNPKVLILGTLPSDDSIKNGSYYNNPTNRFWEIMHHLFGGDVYDKSKDFIVAHKIALWDCLESAKRKGSADKNIILGTETPNDIITFLEQHPTIDTIILNGTTKNPRSGFSTISAFDKYFIDLYRSYNVKALPQTSFSNENYGITREIKLEKWRILKRIIDASK